MYYDLNIPWPDQFYAAGPSTKPASKKAKKDAQSSISAVLPSSKQADVLQGLSPIQREKMRAVTLDLSELGYNVIAYNHKVEGKFDPARHANPFSFLHHSSQSQVPFPELDARHSNGQQGDTNIRQLSRMTLVLNEESMGKGGHGMTAGSTSALLTYDILAGQAFNDASFSLLCLSLSELKPGSIDIITIDLSVSPRLPFFLKRSTVNAAIANGVVFEICYSKVVNKGDAAAGEEGLSKARRNIISGARDILRVTNGKNVIFSSGATDILGLRGPNDVINLGAIFGLNQAAAKDAISSTCRSLLIRAETRKTFRSVVSTPTVVLSSMTTLEPSAAASSSSSSLMEVNKTKRKEADVDSIDLNNTQKAKKSKR